MNDETVVADNSNTAGDVSPQETTEVVSDSFDQSQEETDRLSKAEELARNYKIRAEKAERELKAKVQPSQSPTQEVGDMSKRDLYALMNAKVHEEDVDEVAKWAKFNNITVTDALKDNVMKTLLRDREEKRKIAQATNTGGGRPTSSRLSDEALLDKAQRGQLPESDADIQRLWKVRRGLKG